MFALPHQLEEKFAAGRRGHQGTRSYRVCCWICWPTAAATITARRRTKISRRLPNLCHVPSTIEATKKGTIQWSLFHVMPKLQVQAVILIHYPTTDDAADWEVFWTTDCSFNHTGWPLASMRLPTEGTMAGCCWIYWHPWYSSTVIPRPTQLASNSTSLNL